MNDYSTDLTQQPKHAAAGLLGGTRQSDVSSLRGFEARQQGIPQRSPAFASRQEAAVTTYVITVPGTFLRDVDDVARSELARSLASHHTDLSETEDVELLTVHEDGTFSVRLEVEATDRATAGDDAVRLTAGALEELGFSEKDAPLGPPAVTGVDGQF